MSLRSGRASERARAAPSNVAPPLESALLAPNVDAL